MTARALTMTCALATASLVGACRPGAQSKTDAGPGPDGIGEITRSSESGPVKAVVSLSPSKPTLGDTLHLLLKVTAQKGVEVRMPAFGEALGRFSITAFTPRSATLPDGSTESSQEYQLEAPMSGKQKIPALLVEFVDRREGARAAAGDGGSAAAEPSELLTEEIGLDVASVTEGDEKAGELRGPLGSLDEKEGTGQARRWPIAVAAGAGALLLAIAAAVIARRRRRTAVVRDALAEALGRLTALERRGLPAPDESKETIDAWYVEVSSIVRRYLEDRFGLRAPELTTEEFLARAGESTALAAGHRAVLRSFLERCDRVKFAAWRPPESESREVIAAARRFIEETRPAADPAANPHASPAPHADSQA